jgi:hypothetical protein
MLMQHAGLTGAIDGSPIGQQSLSSTGISMRSPPVEETHAPMAPVSTGSPYHETDSKEGMENAITSPDGAAMASDQLDHTAQQGDRVQDGPLPAATVSDETSKHEGLFSIPSTTKQIVVSYTDTITKDAVIEKRHIPARTAPITASMRHFLRRTMHNLRRTKAGEPYAYALDAKKLKIPTYYDVITRPMDLKEIQLRISCREYAAFGELEDDVLLIQENAKSFFGPDHAMTISAGTLVADFYKRLMKLPGDDVQVEETPQTPKQSGDRVLAGGTLSSRQTPDNGGK